MQETPEFQEAANQLIVGNIINHVKFWVFIGFMLLVAKGVIDLIGLVPAFVTNLMGA